MVCFSLFSRPKTTNETTNETTHTVRLTGDVCPAMGVTLVGNPSLGGLLVVSIGTSDTVMEWNRQNPSMPLEVGQLVVEVNGIKDSDDMIKEMRAAGTVEMLVETELNARQRQIFKQAMKVYQEAQAVNGLLQAPDPCMEPGQVCSICHDDMELDGEKVARLPCGHHFHHHCAKRWLVKHPRCPLCNADHTLSGKPDAKPKPSGFSL